MDETLSCGTVFDTKAVQPYNTLLQTGTPVSAILEQVEPSTLQIIQQLFTKPGNGVMFLAQILRFAEVKQMALPGMEDTAEVAVITLKNIRELSQMIHWGYDTTHKYVIIFCALNLLIKRRSEGRIQLLFPLRQYTPPSTFQALDKLIENSRPKVRQFARRAKHRCILYGIIPHNGSQQEEHSTLEQQVFLQLQSILQDEHIEPLKRQRLLMRISAELLGRLVVLSQPESSPVPARLPVLPESIKPETEAEIVTSGTSSSLSLSLIERATHMHEPIPDQIDTITSEEILPAEEEPEEEMYEPSYDENEEDNELEETSPLSDEKGKEAYEPSKDVSEKGGNREPAKESTPADDRMSARQALMEYFSKPERERKKPVRSSTATGGWRDYLARMNGEQPLVQEKSPSAKENMPAERQETIPVIPKKSPPVEKSAQEISSINRSVEASQRESIPAIQEKSSPVEKLPEQPAEKVDLVKDGVDFSAITQVGITGYSTSFLRAYVTLNVLEFINNNYNNNVNVTSRDELAKFLAEVLDGTSGKWLIYKKKFKQCKPDAIVGALIFTLTSVYDRGGESITNKAALFMKRCKEYQENGVPPNIVMLTNSLKHYTFEGMINFLKDRQQQVKDPRLAGQETVTPVKPGAAQADQASAYEAIPVPRERGKVIAKQGRNIVMLKIAGGGGGEKKRHGDILFKRDT